MSVTRWAAMKRQGWEVSIKVGAFYLDPAIRDMRLVDESVKSVEKYCRHYEKLGWTLESKPKVTRVPVSGPDRVDVYLVDEGQATILIPRNAPGTMRPDSPFHRPGLDRYVIRAVWTHPPLHITVDVPDEKLRRWIAEGTMPAGVRIL